MSQVHVDILKAAKVLVASGEFNYVCNAIFEIRRSDRFNRFTYIECAQITSWIRDSLGKDKLGRQIATLYGWIINNRPNLDPDDVNIRLQWIDWMIDNHTIFDNYRSNY